MCQTPITWHCYDDSFSGASYNTNFVIDNYDALEGRQKTFQLEIIALPNCKQCFLVFLISVCISSKTCTADRDYFWPMAIPLVLIVCVCAITIWYACHRSDSSEIDQDSIQKVAKFDATDGVDNLYQTAGKSIKHAWLVQGQYELVTRYGI